MKATQSYYSAIITSNKRANAIDISLLLLVYYHYQRLESKCERRIVDWLVIEVSQWHRGLVSSNQRANASDAVGVPAARTSALLLLYSALLCFTTDACLQLGDLLYPALLCFTLLYYCCAPAAQRSMPAPYRCLLVCDQISVHNTLVYQTNI